MSTLEEDLEVMRRRVDRTREEMYLAAFSIALQVQSGSTPLEADVATFAEADRVYREASAAFTTALKAAQALLGGRQ